MCPLSLRGEEECMSLRVSEQKNQSSCVQTRFHTLYDFCSRNRSDIEPILRLKRIRAGIFRGFEIDSGISNASESVSSISDRLREQKSYRVWKRVCTHEL